MRKMKIILTGATGYVGEGVMLELLRTPLQYAYICFYPLMRLCGLANNMTEVARSMLACTRDGYKQFVINPRDITKLTKQW